MKEQQKDELFDIYIDTVTELQKFLGLEHFEIDLQGHRELWADASVDITYKYFRASIKFDNKIINNKEHILDTPYNVISRLFMHECFHIFCSVGTTYFSDEADNLKIGLSQQVYAMHHNAILTLEEQMVCTLEKTFIKHFEKTEGYKKLEKRFNSVTKKL